MNKELKDCYIVMLWKNNMGGGGDNGENHVICEQFARNDCLKNVSIYNVIIYPIRRKLVKSLIFINVLLIPVDR